ncbi:MAG: CRISPR-associated endonuclease Cas2 [Planctomycetaceae bacterium]
MRSTYLITYDICQPKRYRKVHQAMCGHGDRLQFSVFRCQLSEIELQQLKEKLWPLLNLSEDRIMVADLGPIEGRGGECLEFWGQPLSPAPRRGAVVI